MINELLGDTYLNFEDVPKSIWIGNGESLKLTSISFVLILVLTRKPLSSFIYNGVIYDRHKKLEPLFENHLKELEEALLVSIYIEKFLKNVQVSKQVDLIGEFDEKSLLYQYEQIGLARTSNLINLVNYLKESK